MKKLLIATSIIAAGIIAISQYMDVEPFDPLEGCESNDELKVVCGFSNPEDLALTPDNNFFIISEYGGQKPIQEVLPGNLALFHIPSRNKRNLLINYDKNTWGDKSCSREKGEVFAPHGLDLIERNDGKLQLAVVSHLPNERVEMFEIVEGINDWSAIWRGCVSTKEKYYLNDVSLKKDGSFYASHMFDIDLSLNEWMFNYYFKFDTGMVIDWNQQSGFDELKETAGSYPNGIMLDIEKNRLAVNYNLGDKTRLFDLDTMEILGEFKNNGPDNVVLRDGYIWVTWHNFGLRDFEKCAGNINCTLPWSVTKLSRDNLKIIKTYSFDSTNMGVGTVGVKVGDELWMGSFKSNRLAYINL
tara:strand:- start:216 stop:1286 length:1071 start_codon:yes stop_codon:yes gene_type:complete